MSPFVKYRGTRDVASQPRDIGQAAGHVKSSQLQRTSTRLRNEGKSVTTKYKMQFVLTTLPLMLTKYDQYEHFVYGKILCLLLTRVNSYYISKQLTISFVHVFMVSKTLTERITEICLLSTRTKYRVIGKQALLLLQLMQLLFQGSSKVTRAQHGNDWGRRKQRWPSNGTCSEGNHGCVVQ